MAEQHQPNSPAARRAVLGLMKEALTDGRAIIRRQLETEGGGRLCAERMSALMDVIVRTIFDFASTRVFPAGNPSAAQRLTLAAVGGYGRSTLAPASDLDLLFLFPYKKTAWSESVTEYMLYLLWDLGLKVGHSTRTVPEAVKAARGDMTVRTALLEARFLCGEPSLFGDLEKRFDIEVVAGTAREFIAAKLAERDARLARAGMSRYLVEPQVKDGKGGQRDLQTLFWMARYYYRKPAHEALLESGLLSRKEFRLFQRCEEFMWSVRCHLHFLSGRAEERLSFELQPELARRLGYQRHPGLHPVERFMKHYFLVAKSVGDLTRIVCAALEDREAKQAPRLNRFLRSFRRSRAPKRLGESEFVVEHNRINVASPDAFARDPVNLIRIFHEAGDNNLAFHPDVMHLMTKSLKLITRDVQEDPEANRLFLQILCAPEYSELVLRHMNETGVLGAFILDFGKVVAMMQFNMYHHYTVDEHLLRAVGNLAGLQTGRLGDDHPLSRNILPTLKDLRVLYVALFLHDIAKGRPQDHSVAGAHVARKLCPRFGLSAQETETVAWLIEQHLTMSMVAQSRDLADRRTIVDFAALVQRIERLQLLLVLTVCDIRAVGPGVWNGWKGQLLRTLYFETEPLLAGSYSQGTRVEQVTAARQALAGKLADWPEAERAALLDLHYPAYWLRVDEATQLRHAALIRAARQDGRNFASEVHPRAFEGATEITVLAPDHPRLLSVMAGVCAATEANIVDAQIFTTTSGMALDTLIIARAFDTDDDERRRGERIAAMIEEALRGGMRLADSVAKKRRRSARGAAFTVEPQVTVTNDLSDRFTVIEVECLDRTGLLYDLTHAISDLSLDITSAHIATFGERAVDTFYVTDLTGHKVIKAREARISGRLLAAIAGTPAASRARVEVSIS